MYQVCIFSYVKLSLIFCFFPAHSHYLVTRLTPLEVLRRQHGAYTEDALMIVNNYQYSYHGFTLSTQDIEELAARLRVGESIITFNADRLRGISYFLCQLHESFRRHILHKKDVALKEPRLNSKQMALALEFYLQIDSKYLCHLSTQCMIVIVELLQWMYST